MSKLLPQRLINRYAEDGSKYVGWVTAIRFEGSDIRGLTGLSLYRGDPKKPLVRSRSEYPETIIMRGEVRNSRDSGYREDIVGDFANSDIILPDSILDQVFSPIEKRLLKVYNEVFVDQGSKTPIKTQQVEGVIVEVEHTFNGIGQSLTLYDVRDPKGFIHRLGVGTHTSLLGEGDLARFDFINEVAGRREVEQPFEVGTNVIQVLKRETKYLKIVGWTKLEPTKTN